MWRKKKRKTEEERGRRGDRVGEIKYKKEEEEEEEGGKDKAAEKE